MNVRRGLRRAGEADALVLTAGVWFLAKFLRYAFPPLFATFQESYGVSNTLLGTAFTGMMLVYAAMQFPSGAVADRLGAVRVIVGGAVTAAGAALLLALAVPFPVLVAGMLLVGAGTGVHKTVAVGLISAVYPDRTGRALGVMDTFGAFGGVVAPAAVVVLSGDPGWHAVFLAGGLVGLALAGLFTLRVPARAAGTAAAGSAASRGVAVREYAGLFADRRFAAFVAVTLLFSFAYNGAVAFLPLYLSERAGLSTATAGTLYSTLFLVSVVQPVTGDLSDRVGALPVLSGSLGLATAGLVGVVALADAALPVAPVPATGAAVVVFGLGSHGFRPVRGAYLIDVLPDEAAGGALGIVRTMLMGAGAFAPAVVGVVSDGLGFRPAFGLLAAALAAGFLLTVGLQRTG
jgi:MFS family permease